MRKKLQATGSKPKAKKKCFVIMVSRVFPVTHPRAGTITGFIPKIELGKKKHTIRRNYELWKKRINEVNAGRAYLSLRFWIGRPYASKQHEFLRLEKAVIQKIEIYNEARQYCVLENLPTSEMCARTGARLLSVIAENDGLTLPDFLNWFFPRKRKPAEPEIFTGGIIQFNADFKY